jgi:leucyl aminopeptidase
MAIAEESQDPIWQLPLHQGYKHQLKSDVADLVNSASSGYGGAITAALFLQDFVSKDVDWLHFDVMAYNMRSRSGRPKGGEAMGLRAICHYLEQRYLQ